VPGDGFASGGELAVLGERIRASVFGRVLPERFFSWWRRVAPLSYDSRSKRSRLEVGLLAT
jgi:hypothetical protein